MACLSFSVRMLLQYQLPAIATLLFLLSRPQLCTAASHKRVKARRHFFYNEYKGVLKAANMTEFPEGDIRNLLIEGHEWTRNKNKLSESSEPEVVTQQMSKTPSSTSNSATGSSRRQRKKKEGQKSRKRFPKVSKPYVSSSTTLWRKKLFSMRRQETEELMRAESNELASQPGKPAKSPSTGKTPRRSSRKERRRKGRKKFPRKPATTKPIQGETTLSLNIARLKQRCKTKPMKQEIKVQGCLSKSIMNNLCYGQCNSFYIPEIRGKGNGPPSFVSCGFCRPKTVRPIYVTLKCPNRRGRIRWKRKKISYVKKCRCMEQEIQLDSL